MPSLKQVKRVGKKSSEASSEDSKSHVITMNRRHFVFHSLLPLACAGNLFASSRPAHETSVWSVDYLFIDDRFLNAQSLVGKFPSVQKIMPVRGDITPFWNNELKFAVRQTPLGLYGVTTESFYFCLHRMLRSGCQVSADIQRVDKDLYAWSITMLEPINDMNKRMS